MTTDNGNGRATLATLETQVATLDRSQEQIRRNISGLENEIKTSSRDLTNKLESAINGLHTKLDAKSATPWQTIWTGFGAIAAVLIAIGTSLYLPIQRDTARLDTAVAAILDRGVFQKQYDVDQGRSTELFRGLRSTLDTTIQQQRYNTDQERLTRRLEEIDRQMEFLRVRSFDSNTRVAHNEQELKGLETRFDAVSRRLAEFIRDMGNH